MTRLNHIGIAVHDVTAAARWYERVLGWRRLGDVMTVTTESPSVAGQLRSVFRASDVAFEQAHMVTEDGTGLEIFGFTRPHPTAGPTTFAPWSPGLSHFCVLANDIESLAASIAREGGRQASPIQPIFPDAPYRFCYCEDPFGNLIELATHPYEEAFAGRHSYDANPARPGPPE